MNVLDTYLRQVGRWVPPGQRKVVLEKVQEDLKEAIGDDDDSALIAQRLRAFGAPQVVAARYVDYPHVIPGVLVPAYLVVLMITLAGVFLVNLMLVIPRALHGADWLGNIAQAFALSFFALPWAFTAITLVFAALGYWVQRRAHHSCS